MRISDWSSDVCSSDLFATAQLERQVDIGGDFQLYFAPFNVKFYAEDIRIANPAWARAKQFFTAKKVDTRLATLPLIFGNRILRFADLDGDRKSTRLNSSH